MVPEREWEIVRCDHDFFHLCKLLMPNYWLMVCVSADDWALYRGRFRSECRNGRIATIWLENCFGCTWESCRILEDFFELKTSWRVKDKANVQNAWPEHMDAFKHVQLWGSPHEMPTGKRWSNLTEVTLPMCILCLNVNCVKVIQRLRAHVRAQVYLIRSDQQTPIYWQ